MLALTAWSLVLSVLWQLGTGTALVFNLLAVAVGARYILCEGMKSDQRNFYLYNVRRSRI